jgi:hypothetical protein
MQRGHIPKRSNLIKWADAIGEPRDKWLAFLEQPQPPNTPAAHLDLFFRGLGRKVSQEDLKAIREILDKYIKE